MKNDESSRPSSLKKAISRKDEKDQRKRNTANTENDLKKQKSNAKITQLQQMESTLLSLEDQLRQSEEVVGERREQAVSLLSQLADIAIATPHIHSHTYNLQKDLNSLVNDVHGNILPELDILDQKLNEKRKDITKLDEMLSRSQVMVESLNCDNLNSLDEIISLVEALELS